jgi:general secretion pathway protein D
MIPMNKKVLFAPALVALMCSCLTLSVFAQGGGGGGGRGGGGGGGLGGGGGGRGGAGGGGVGQGASASVGYAPNGQVAPITMTTDPVSGSIIYMTDDTNNMNVLRALQGLDVVQPQVLIKVVFLQVTYNNALDVGVEGAFNPNFNPNILGRAVTAGASNSFGLLSQGIANGPNPAISGAGAALAVIQGNNFEADIRALQQKGTVKILSRPTIMVRTGQPGNITIGQEVPLVGSVNVTLGVVSTSITYTSVGIILNVTPYVRPNGDVEMILNPQVSSVSANQSTTVSQSTNGNFTTPYINTESANTVVVTPDGQTVVIGGLMQDTKSVTDTGIPVLSDIPLLGNLFKHKVKSEAQTELMIFVTPFVVRSPRDLARMSADESSRLTMYPKMFPQKERDTYIDPTSNLPATPAAVETAPTHP